MFPTLSVAPPLAETPPPPAQDATLRIHWIFYICINHIMVALSQTSILWQVLTLQAESPFEFFGRLGILYSGHYSAEGRKE
ncbi:hypothetical protein QCA50_010916 [Cerrena zonata]|uniref:Uncharacterized protein n=1 Tax=Cerrena zonata TaxID=2478898 RepID=A0AAW0G444_9APHY